MFLAPWFLAGLLAIGLPILLHRIARTERVKVSFASLMLLEASEVRDTSRRTLKYWLLLALRILFVLLLALAFAQPLINAMSSIPGAAPTQLHAIVLDTSLSMQHGERWSRAIEKAQALIAGLQRTDRAMLVAASGRRVELVAGPVFGSETGVLSGALNTLKPSQERLDYGLLMSGAGAWLAAESLPTQLHIVTDVQQSASPLRFADLAPPANTRVQLHDVSEPGSENLGVVAVQLASNAAAGDRVISATVRGTTGKTPRTLAMWIDDQAFPAQRVAVNDHGVGQVIFAGVKLRAGSHQLRFELQPADALAQDDRYFAVIEHTEPTVLLITRDPAADEAAYFAAAIESQVSMRLNVERATPQTLAKTLAARPLTDFSAVVVADSGILSSGAARQLAQYVDAGGAVLATLGPYAAQLDAEPITQMRLSRTRDVEQRIAHVDDSHPVLRDASGWSAVRFMKHIDVRLAEGEAAQERALISLADGSPLLIERGGAGRLLLLTAPLDRAWNDLAIHPLFVRFIADTARYLTQRDASAMSYTVGSRIVTGVIAGEGGQIFDPTGARALTLADANDASQLTPALAGFYEVRSGKQRRWLAVNVDARESDLTPMSSDGVERWLGLVAPSAPRAAADAAAGAMAGAAKPERFAIGWQLLIAAAVLLLIEQMLANYRLTVRRDGTQVALS